MQHGLVMTSPANQLQEASLDILENLKCYPGLICRVRTGPGNPGKSLNFKKLFSRPGKSWNCDAGPGKPGKDELGYFFRLR